MGAGALFIWRKLIKGICRSIAYEIAGDAMELNSYDFILLYGSANRAKSWSCEHCTNWQSDKKKEVCLSCYWAFPGNYSHVTRRQIRRLDLMWQGDEIEKYENLKSDAKKAGMTIPNFVKDVLAKTIKK